MVESDASRSTKLRKKLIAAGLKKANPTHWVAKEDHAKAVKAIDKALQPFKPKAEKLRAKHEEKLRKEKLKKDADNT